VTGRHRAAFRLNLRNGDLMQRFAAGREPALIAALIGIAIKLFGAWLDLGIEQQALLNAITLAVIGVFVAVVTHDGLSAGIVGLAQAGIALLLGFGLRIDGDTQVMIMSTIALAVSMYERTQITAPVPPPPTIR
jgi:hypothetical protein